MFRYVDLIQNPSLLDLVLKYDIDPPLPASYQADRCAWLELRVLADYSRGGLVGTKGVFQHKVVGFFPTRSESTY